MKRKWKDTRGETLVEVLASILIGALSVALLFSAVVASGSIGRKSGKAEEEFSESLKAAEEQLAPAAVPTPNEITVKNSASMSEKKVAVNFYGGKGAWSFAALPTPTPTPTPP